MKNLYKEQDDFEKILKQCVLNPKKAVNLFDIGTSYSYSYLEVFIRCYPLFKLINEKAQLLSKGESIATNEEYDFAMNKMLESMTLLRVNMSMNGYAKNNIPNFKKPVHDYAKEVAEKLFWDMVEKNKPSLWTKIKNFFLKLVNNNKKKVVNKRNRTFLDVSKEAVEKNKAESTSKIAKDLGWSKISFKGDNGVFNTMEFKAEDNNKNNPASDSDDSVYDIPVMTETPYATDMKSYNNSPKMGM